MSGAEVAARNDGAARRGGVGREVLEEQATGLPDGALMRFGQVADRLHASAQPPFPEGIGRGGCGSRIAEAISPTPVRFALYRLVGEALVVDHARGGMHVPLLTEVEMRDLYDWMERVLLMACDVGRLSAAREAEQSEPASTDGDTVMRTWQLFDAVARRPAE
ncbi:MAG TPA: hypothetical protein VHO91_10195 [Rhodopila sp.]|nr:hypothetical protein [Rhodopila sp.]